jgi:hypothetical protein
MGGDAAGVATGGVVTGGGAATRAVVVAGGAAVCGTAVCGTAGRGTAVCGTAGRGTATRGAVMGSAVMGSAVMGGSAATAAAAAISAADVARSKLAAEEASDAGDGAPSSQLSEAKSARRAVGADGPAADAAGRAGAAAAGAVWPRGSERLPGAARRAVGGVWIALAPGERRGSELAGRGRGGSVGPWSGSGDCLAAADPRAGRNPRRTCPGVSPFAPGTRRGSSDGSSCGGGRLSSAMRRTPPAATKGALLQVNSAAHQGLPYNRNRPSRRNKHGQIPGSGGFSVPANAQVPQARLDWPSQVLAVTR